MIAKSILEKQLKEAEMRGWLAHFQEAAGQTGLPAALLMGIGSRETNLNPKYLTVAGDNGNGYGLMQVDKRSEPQWVAAGLWKDARSCILKGAQMLAAKRDSIIRQAGQSVTLRDSKGNRVSFIMPKFEEPTLTQVFVAAYNCGLWSCYHASKGRDVDFGTTGKDYSKDVLCRASIFEALLAAR
ncbi:MAG: hypothetical protein HY231_23960 [Acidobacteria bacterium]|nr:hypothetical protein [Acidobacteriota bacterium]